MPISEDEDGNPGLFGRILEFCRTLKAVGLNVTSGRMVDAFRAVRCIDVHQRDDFRIALRTNLVASREDEENFDKVFAAFWDEQETTEMAPIELQLEESGDRQHQEVPDTPPEIQGSPKQYTRDEALRDKDLTAQWPGELSGMKAILRELARRLATRPSRRFRASRRGRRIDLRRSMRKNVRYGMDVMELTRAQRRIRKTRLVLLCDVSGSMDVYNPFLLRLMLGLQKGFKNSRTAVFSTRVTEITRALRRQSVHETLVEVAAIAKHWSGGTDIGAALANFNRGILREGSASSTVGIILSDGYDQGEPVIVKREMQALSRRTRAIVWINPLLGTEGYAPVAQGMRAALPHVDYFLPAYDLPSLRALCRTLGEV
jgi:uncharacterized protein with von Willebrand factor type A (vWA) domain